MGNALIPRCVRPISPEDNKVKVLFWGGATRTLDGTQPAGELLVEFPDQLVCHAGSFYIGQPVPSLSIGDQLLAGETYLVIPADLLACSVLTAGSVASLSSAGSKKKPIGFGDNPFEFVRRGEDSLIKVLPEFIAKVIAGEDSKKPCGTRNYSELCSTPELRKHYEQLVGARTPPWSPKLETISEKKRSSLSPRRLMRRQ